MADESLKKDKEIVLEAVKKDGYAMNFADSSFIDDKDFRGYLHELVGYDF